MTQASYPDDAPWRKRFCEFVFAALMTSQKTGATVFLFLFFAWFMHDSWGGCSAHAFVCHSSLTSTDGPQERRSNLTTSWSFILLSNPPAALHRRSNLAACVCVCICVCIRCPELHHPPVTVQNHTRCVFHLQTPACGWQAVQVCCHLKAEHDSTAVRGGGWWWWWGGTPTHTSYSRNVSVVLCIEKKNIKLCLALWPGLCSKLYRFSKQSLYNICFISK